MRLDSLYYFTEVAKDLHITRTAERLYMSQQTLSNHIARLEQYYGTRLLTRKPKLELTYSGELVLSFAERVTRQNLNLKDRLAEIKHEVQGPVRLAAAQLRIDSCLPSVMAQYALEYPEVEIRVTNAATEQAIRLVLDDEVDVAITFTATEPELTCDHLISDQIFLCVSHHLLQDIYGEDADRMRDEAELGTSLAEFADLPFCMLRNRLGDAISGCFADVGIEPRVHLVVPSIQTGALIGIQGLAAFFSTRTSLLNYPGYMPGDIDIFPLLRHGEPLRQNLYIVYRTDKYLASYLKRFIELVREFFRITEATPVGPCARDASAPIGIPRASEA